MAFVLSSKIKNNSFIPFLLDKGARIMESRYFHVFLVCASLFCIIATYVAFTSQSYGVDETYWQLNLDLVILLLFLAVLARNAVKLWGERKQGIAGSKLHVRLVFVFGLLVAIPAILMAVFSSLFLYFGILSWFNDRVNTAVTESLSVAQAYLKEHQHVMKVDVLAMANDLNRSVTYLEESPKNFNQMIETQSSLRNLSEAIVLTSKGHVLARSRFTFTLEFDDPISKDTIEKTRDGSVVFLPSEKDDRLKALVKLKSFEDTFLFVGRFVDASVLKHMETVEEAVQEYTELRNKGSSIQISATLMFIAVALVLLLAAVWFSLIFAQYLITPIRRLITAAEQVGNGDLTARVEETGQDDEFEVLAVGFNRMTQQLEEQTQNLTEVNKALDSRRRFIETVLSGVSSGIVGVNKSGEITLANVVAAKLLGHETVDSLTGKILLDELPEISDLLKNAYKKPSASYQEQETQIEYKLKDSDRLSDLLVRVSIDVETKDAVVTFDDISELVSAQRKAAWSDVARRIAHEIKNPLTPIQLSAERLNRKYLSQITENPEAFEKCTTTIIRQVGEIGRMVNEFASFARMPEPIKSSADIIDICLEAVTLHKQAHKDIKFSVEKNVNHLALVCDRGQLAQVMTNLLQNAIESVYESDTQNKKINIKIVSSKGTVKIIVSDNGKGLPKGNRSTLTEPYVTHKKKGTGLGLAIVKKILADHSGTITLENRKDSDNNKKGALVTITLPIG